MGIEINPASLSDLSDTDLEALLDDPQATGAAVAALNDRIGEVKAEQLAQTIKNQGPLVLGPNLPQV